MGFQLAAIVVVQSRGAFLGLLASVFYLGLLLAARAGNRRLLGGLTIAALAVVGLLLLINLPGSPLVAVREIPYVGRLAQALDPKAITGQQRIMQWGAGVDLVTSDPARLLVGYGPDTTRYAIGPFVPAGLFTWKPLRQNDRVHNELLDILAAGGLVSLAAYLLLFLSAVRLGLAGLGLLGQRRREAWLLAAFSLGGGLLAGVTAWVLAGNPAFLVPVFGLGLVMGLCLYLLVHPFLAAGPGAGPGIKGEDRQLLVAGLLASLVGHLAALQFSFGLTVNRTLFWVFLALLVALVTQAEDAPPSLPPSGRGRRKRRRPAPSVRKPRPAAPSIVR